MTEKPLTNISDLSLKARIPNVDIKPVTKSIVRKEKKRSKNGCLSCKKLRIKCNESKPRCEYCVHTNRECVYPEVADMENRKRTADKTEKRVDRVLKTWTSELQNPAPGRTFKGLTCELMLNSSTKLLNISTFELRLLNFFNSYCISLISFGVNMNADRTWRNQVPKLFLQSDLVRQSIYLFSTINLWPLCDFQSILDAHTDYSIDNDEQRIDAIVDCKLLKESLTLEPNRQDPNQNLFLKTSKYFMNTLANTGYVLSRKDVDTKMDEITASELLVSGILIFAFLGIHPHRLVSLVSFDDPTETDFLSIVRGIRNTLNLSYEALATSDYIGVLPLIDTSIKTNMLKNSIVHPTPVTKEFRSQLSEYYCNKDNTTTASDNYAALKSSLSTLELYMSKSILFNYPVPLFAWLLSLLDDLHDMIRAKNCFALRLLYIYTSLTCITRFQLYNSKNIWVDFILWFRDYNLKYFNGRWQYESDEKLYRIVIEEKYKIRHNNFHKLSTFDPNSFFDNDGQ